MPGHAQLEDKALVLTSDKCAGEWADLPRTRAAADPLEL